MPGPFAPEQLAAGARTFERIAVGGDAVWWVHGRPDEKGRAVVIR